jgi:NADPH:quinone reductase-like Zn-dependent oxidoreductase
MQAALYNPDGKGDFIISNIPLPKFGENELLIQVKAAAINPIDYKVITPNLPFLRWFLPHTVGHDFSGIVIDVGEKVTKFNIGDSVYGNAAGGSLQEFTNVKEYEIGKKAENLNFSEAASIGLAAATSLQSLKYWYNDYEDLENKKILIIGGSGGCGSLAIQIAKYFKANVTTSCSEKNIKFVEELGADKVIDYTKLNFLNELESELESNSDYNFDLIYDTVTSPEDSNQEIIYKRFLKADGKYVAINGDSKDWSKAILKKMCCNFERKNFHLLMLNWNTEDLELLKKISEEGKLRSKYSTFQFDRLSVNEAFDKLKSRRTVGKLIFEI